MIKTKKLTICEVYVRKDDFSNRFKDDFKVWLTKTETKALFKMYSRLGFAGVEIVENTGEYDIREDTIKDVAKLKKGENQ